MLALCQLIQLRDCYNDNWVPDWSIHTLKSCIGVYKNKVVPLTCSLNSKILVFKTAGLRDEFLNNFGFGGFFGGGGSSAAQRQAEEKRRQELIRQQEEERKRLNEKKLKELTKKAQGNWQKLSENLKKSSGIFLLTTIGAVVKALTFLQNEEEGKPTNLTMEQKVRMYQILQQNRDIIMMLAKAHKEALRRQQEEANLVEDQQELERMKQEEERRKAEEKKK
jgi:hypothetical protein